MSSHSGDDGAVVEGTVEGLVSSRITLMYCEFALCDKLHVSDHIRSCRSSWAGTKAAKMASQWYFGSGLAVSHSFSESVSSWPKERCHKFAQILQVVHDQLHLDCYDLGYDPKSCRFEP